MAKRGWCISIPWLPTAVVDEIVRRAGTGAKHGARFSGYQCQWIGAVVKVIQAQPKRGAPRRDKSTQRSMARYEKLAASGRYRSQAAIICAMADTDQGALGAITSPDYDPAPKLKKRLQRAYGGQWPEIMKAKKGHK